jgi:acetyl-CoA acetyltransferase
VAVQVGGSIDAGLGGLAAGVASVEHAKRPALVIGVESSSRAPYWSRGLRWRASQGDADLVDPVGAVLAAQGRREEPRVGDREAQDAFALRSRQRIAASPGAPEAKGPGTLAPIAGVEGDEPPGRERSQKELAALKPVFDEEGVVTVGSIALPADGAAAVLITADGDGPELCRSAPSPEAALELVGRGPDEIATAEIYEGTAAEVLSVAGSIRMDPDAVNPAGGAIGQGSPFAAAGILMALRLGSRLRPGEVGLLAGPGCATVMIG